MIGCAEPTGTNCNAESPCCASDQLAAPTLTSLDQLSYTNLTSTSDCVHVPAGTEAPSDGTFTPDGDKTIAVHRGAIAPSAGTFCQTYKLPGYKTCSTPSKRNPGRCEAEETRSRARSRARARARTRKLSRRLSPRTPPDTTRGLAP